MIDALDVARQRLDFAIWAWVFMPDHVHLIILPRRAQYDMAAIRRLIKEPVSRQALAWIRQHAPTWLPRLARRRGERLEHLFWQSGGGYDRNIIEPRTLGAMMTYLHENPVRAGFVTRSVEWKWSSAAWYVSQQRVPLEVDRIPPEWIAPSGLGP